MGRATRRNRITSPEKTALINPFNIRLRDEFLDYLTAVGRSEGTIAGYRSDLLIIFTLISERLGNKKFPDLTKRDLIALQGMLLNEHGNSPARVRRLKSAISSLSNYCQDVLDDDPEFAGFHSIVRKIESPALQPVREKTVWEDEELDALMEKLSADGQHDKACMVALAVYGGRRKAELCRFRVSDFADDRLVCGGALYKSAPIRTKGRSGGKYLPCYTLAKGFRPYLEKWLQYRTEHGIESEWLFPMDGDPSTQIQESTLNSWALTFSKITERPFYWHSLRHSFTTRLVRAGIPDGVIQEIVGWASSDMVKVYTDIDADEQIGMYFKDGDISAPKKKNLGEI